jgi:hypothetical protein
MVLAERLDSNAQDDSAQDRTMSPQRRHELFGWLGRVQHGRQEGIPVRTGKHHPLMLVENPARSLIGEIPGGQPRDGHRPLDKLLGRRGDAQLNALFLELAVDWLFEAL